MYLTAAQLTSVRSRPHRTRLWLGVYQPQTIFSAQINQSGISKGERAITVTALSGDSGGVVRGMTCYIGTTVGGRDIGHIRIISATDTIIELAENSYSWTDGWFLTVVQYHEPWTIFPRITLDDDNVAIFYKDFDIVYTDQNQTMEPIVNMGPHYAGFLDTAPSGTYEQVWYTSSGSFDPTPGGSISSYDWAFEGGQPTGSTSAHPGYVEYTGSGYYLTRLRQVTGDGKTGTAYRHVMILDRPGAGGDNEPIKAWGIRSFDGDRESGGYNVALWIREAAGLSVITEGSLVVIFSDDFEGNSEVAKVGANAENRGHILYSGYVLEDTIAWNPVTSRLDFDTSSVTGRMEELATFATSLESKVNALTWTELRLMTVDRAVIHFMRWHSTVLGLHDFSQTGDTKQVKFADFERGTLYESVNNFLMNTLIGSMVSDRQGKMWAEVIASVIPTGSSRQANNHMQNVLDMGSRDWRNEISILRRQDSELAYLEMGGIYYSGPTSTGGIAAFLAGAPGVAPDYFGTVERVQGLVITSQGQLNTLVGLGLAMKNAVYPEVDVPIAGDYRFLDIAPQHRILMTVASIDTHRGIVWDQKPFVTHEISYEWKPKEQSLLMELGLVEETGGEPGFGDAATITIPIDPPYDDWTLPDWDIDSIPPILPPSPQIPPVEPPPGGGNIAYIVHQNSLARTTNFWDESPNWEAVGVTGTAGIYRGFYLDPYDPQNTAMLLTHIFGNGPQIYHTTNLSAAQPAWVEVWGSDENTTFFGGSATAKGYELVPSFREAGVWYMICSDAELGGGGSVDLLLKTLDSGANWASSVGGFPADNALDGCVTVSPYHNTVWCVAGGGPPAVQAHHFRSTDGGLVNVQKPDFANGVGPIFLLEDDTSPDRAVIAQSGGLRITANGGGTYSDFRPSDEVGTWGIPTPEYQQRMRWFVSHPANKWMYSCLLKTGSATYAFFARAGIGGTWEKRHTFIGAISGMMGYNITNPLQFYIKGTLNDFHIMGSEDGGKNWLDKEGDFEAQVMVFTDLSTTIGFQVVWTAG